MTPDHPTPTTKFRVAVVGATGFMGAELVRLLLDHPQVDLTYLAGHSSAGKQLSEVRPGFLAHNLPIRPVELPAISQEADTVFLALPHGESAIIAEQLLDQGLTVFDLGSDFRLKDPADVKKYYDREAPPQPLLDQAVYCLPELTGPPPKETKLIACPGCFATALNLTVAALAPLASHLDIFGITGSSGSGITPATGVHHSLRPTNFVAYKSLRHQHLGEVDQLQRQRGNSAEINFVPHSAPLIRGIHLTTVVEATAAEVESRFQTLYADKPLIHLIPGPAPLASVVQTNLVRFGWEETQGRTAVYCTIDNLLKGGSGQAVQIFNLLNNLPETTALPKTAPWP